MLEILFCFVFAISDGDTFTAKCENKTIKIRISAIDSPESDQPFGAHSTKALAKLCFNKFAKIEIQGWDRYKRAVADVECQNKDVDEYLVENGWAWVYDRYAKKHLHLYPLQGKAQVNKLGLWVEDNPISPWKWRRKRK